MITTLSALLTPLIAIVAVYIAYQQWQTNRQKFRLDRYDRRLKIYQETIRILSLVMRNADVEYDELLKFNSSVSEADFLFGREIPKYLGEIYSRGVTLHYWNKEYRSDLQPIPPNYNHNKVVDGMHAEITWFSAQFEPSKALFKKYLDVSQ